MTRINIKVNVNQRWLVEFSYLIEISESGRKFLRIELAGYFTRNRKFYDLIFNANRRRSKL